MPKTTEPTPLELLTNEMAVLRSKIAAGLEDVKQITRRLRKIVFAYLMADPNPVEFEHSKELWMELNGLFDFLEELEDKQLSGEG